ncbi:hypothetical protein NWF24_07795 [Variovorax paradoxus]|uniref:hypothetical protein n=1 Tax=Variovorax paradoxus TaxID=34073 RepID=UPI0021ACC771|nr:hypothetical protein [Variovorax paradoxus]UVH59304.1 hypothetical protein NWF24_07795 [Variovorax paradoxus]
MIKAHPSVIPGDSDIYGASPSVVSLALNARRLFDSNYGARFDENTVVRLGAVVGLLFHSAQGAEWDDSVLESFFRQLALVRVEKLYAIPTGYEYARDPDAAMEILDFEPPLLGSINPTIDDFSKVRGGQIGLYSGSHFLFSPCLNFSLLDVNGQYTMILGPRRFVDSIFGSAVEATWSEINPNFDIDPPSSPNFSTPKQRTAMERSAQGPAIPRPARVD